MKGIVVGCIRMPTSTGSQLLPQYTEQSCRLLSIASKLEPITWTKVVRFEIAMYKDFEEYDNLEEFWNS
jgi:hypothetical protein